MSSEKGYPKEEGSPLTRKELEIFIDSKVETFKAQIDYKLEIFKKEILDHLCPLKPKS